MTDFSSIAQEASTVTEAVMKVLPTAGGIIGLIPGAQLAGPAAAAFDAFLGVLDNAFKLVSDSKPGAAPEDILQEITNHLTPGQPASPALT